MSSDSVITLSGWLFPLKMIQRRQKHLVLEPRPAFDTWSTTITVLWLHQFWKSAAIVKEGGGGGSQGAQLRRGPVGGSKVQAGCAAMSATWTRNPALCTSGILFPTYKSQLRPHSLPLAPFLPAICPPSCTNVQNNHLISLLGYFCKFPAISYSSLNSWGRQFRHNRTLTWILKLNVTLGVFSVCFSRLPKGFLCQMNFVAVSCVCASWAPKWEIYLLSQLASAKVGNK